MTRPVLSVPNNQLVFFIDENRLVRVDLRDEDDNIPDGFDASARLDLSITNRSGVSLITRNSVDDPADVYVEDADTAEVVFWLYTADLNTTLGKGTYLYSLKVTIGSSVFVAIEPSELQVKPSGF